MTNLLAFGASGLSFAGFAGLMGLPWVVSIAVEYVVFRRFFRRELSGTSSAPSAEAGRPPVFALVVLTTTLVGFLVVPAVWAAVAGAVVLGAHAVHLQRVTVKGVWSAASVPFLLFVLALGVVVAAVQQAGLREIIAELFPSGGSFPALLTRVHRGLPDPLPQRLRAHPQPRRHRGDRRPLRVVITDMITHHTGPLWSWSQRRTCLT